MQMIDLVDDLRPIILAARQYADDRNSLAQFLPNTPVQAITYRLGRRKRVDQAAPIRAFDAPATPIKRPGAFEVRGELPAVTPIINLTETDLNQEFILAQQLAGIEVSYDPWVTAAAGIAVATVDNTFELMRGQLLSSTVISLEAEDGEIHEVDFGVDPGRLITVGAEWDPSTQAGAKAIFDDLRAAHRVHIEGSGAKAGLALTTEAMESTLLSALAALFPNAPMGMISLNQYLTDQKLPRIVTNDRTLKNEDGSRTRIYPEGHLTFLPGTDPIGRTELGVTQEAVQQVQNKVLGVGEAPGVTVVTLGEDNPVQRAVKAAAVGLPVLQDNEDITVISGAIAA